MRHVTELVYENIHLAFSFGFLEVEKLFKKLYFSIIILIYKRCCIILLFPFFLYLSSENCTLRGIVAVKIDRIQNLIVSTAKFTS